MSYEYTELSGGIDHVSPDEPEPGDAEIWAKIEGTETDGSFDPTGYTLYFSKDNEWWKVE